jgi:hypothetical protein
MEPKTIDYIFITHGLKRFVTQAGEMSRNETNTADHPALFLDLNGKEALSNDFDTIFNFGQNQRKLWNSDRKAVHEYVKILEQLFTDNCIQQRLAALNNTPPNQWTTTHSKKYDTLDQHITRLMLRAERKCKKGNIKSYMWSDDLHLAGSRTSYWNALKKSLLTTRNITARTLDIKRKMAQIPPHPTKSITEVRQELKLAKKPIKDIRNKHVEYRRLYLERKAAAIDLDNDKDPNKSSTLLQLIRHEEMRRLYRKCKQHLGKEIGQGLTEIMVPLNPQ